MINPNYEGVYRLGTLWWCDMGSQIAMHVKNYSGMKLSASNKPQRTEYPTSLPEHPLSSPLTAPPPLPLASFIPDTVPMPY